MPEARLSAEARATIVTETPIRVPLRCLPCSPRAPASQSQLPEALASASKRNTSLDRRSRGLTRHLDLWNCKHAPALCVPGTSREGRRCFPNSESTNHTTQAALVATPAHTARNGHAQSATTSVRQIITAQSNGPRQPCPSHMEKHLRGSKASAQARRQAHGRRLAGCRHGRNYCWAGSWLIATRPSVMSLMARNSIVCGIPRQHHPPPAACSRSLVVAFMWQVFDHRVIFLHTTHALTCLCMALNYSGTRKSPELLHAGGLFRGFHRLRSSLC